MENKKQKNKAKIVSFDIETAPTTAYVWRRWKENIRLDQVISEGYLLCAVAKFLDEKKPRTIALTDYPKLWKENPEDDIEVVKWCWDILDEADIVIAHFGKKFDIPVLNARFIALGLNPPSPYRIIDTCEQARKRFKFPYNSLDGIGDYLGLGRKIETKFSLWTDCLRGVKRAWKDMVAYCVQDVLLLEKVYKKMVPWIENHPNLALYDLNDTRPCCPKCGGYKISWRGYSRSTTQVYHRFRCKKCGGWGRERFTCVDKRKKTAILTHAVTS
jgi:DNA polymerase elongation subunit (family B)